MRVTSWWAAFGAAAVVHAAGLALASQGLLDQVPFRPQTEYLEVELAMEPPVSQQMPSLAVPAVPDAAGGRSNIHAASQPAVPAIGPAANAAFAPAEAQTAVKPSAMAAVDGSLLAAAMSDSAASAIESGSTAEAGSGSAGRVSPAAESGAEQEVDSQPYVLDAPLPEYPPEARLNKWQGRVLVRVLVEVSGRVADAQLAKSSGYEQLDQAAEAVIYRWRFNPAYRDGQPVKAWVKVPVAFKLR